MNGLPEQIGKKTAVFTFGSNLPTSSKAGTQKSPHSPALVVVGPALVHGVVDPEVAAPHLAHDRK